MYPKEYHHVVSLPLLVGLYVGMWLFYKIFYSMCLSPITTTINRDIVGVVYNIRRFKV